MKMFVELCFYDFLPVTVSSAAPLLRPPLQTKLAGEAQAKYERELMLHAADVEALQELKKRGQQEAAQKRKLEEQVDKTSSLLQEKTTAFTTLENQLKVGRLRGPHKKISKLRSIDRCRGN